MKLIYKGKEYEASGSRIISAKIRGQVADILKKYEKPSVEDVLHDKLTGILSKTVTDPSIDITSLGQDELKALFTKAAQDGTVPAQDFQDAIKAVMAAQNPKFDPEEEKSKDIMLIELFKVIVYKDNLDEVIIAQIESDPDGDFWQSQDIYGEEGIEAEVNLFRSKARLTK